MIVSLQTSPIRGIVADLYCSSPPRSFHPLGRQLTSGLPERQVSVGELGCAGVDRKEGGDCQGESTDSGSCWMGGKPINRFVLRVWVT